MTVNCNFLDLEVCNFHNWGIGNARMMKSVTTLIEPIAMKSAPRLTQLGLRAGFQFASTGKHWKTVTSIDTMV